MGVADAWIGSNCKLKGTRFCRMKSFLFIMAIRGIERVVLIKESFLVVKEENS